MFSIYISNKKTLKFNLPLIKLFSYIPYETIFSNYHNKYMLYQDFTLFNTGKFFSKFLKVESS